jgi:AcrR family transcriptional regulator
VLPPTAAIYAVLVPQRSNRNALIEGTLRCFASLPISEITAREIADRAEANLASIGYHFGSKDALIAHAMAEGFKRWLAELTAELAGLPESNAASRLFNATQILQEGARRHRGLISAFLSAIAAAPHDHQLRQILGDEYSNSRQEVASLLELGDDDDGHNAAALVLAAFDGLLIQALIGGDIRLQSDVLQGGLTRLAAVFAQA